MQPKSKNIIQWNFNGFYKNIDEIKIIIHLYQPIALCLQETNLKSDDPSSNFKNYNLFKKTLTSA